MPKFIVENIIKNIQNSDLENIFRNFEKKLVEIEHYYSTKCSKCNHEAYITKVVFDKPIRTVNDFSIKAISYNCPKCGKCNKEPTNEDYQKFSIIDKINCVPNQRLMQNSKIAVGKSDTISDLFTPRNYAILNEIVSYINASNNKDILNYLLMSVLHLSKITDTHSNSQWPLWIPKLNCVEKNIIELLRKRMKSLLSCKEYILNNYSNSNIVNNFNALKANKALILTKGSQYITTQEIPAIQFL